MAPHEIDLGGSCGTAFVAVVGATAAVAGRRRKYEQQTYIKYL
jgi:hypothetical protein